MEIRFFGLERQQFDNEKISPFIVPMKTILVPTDLSDHAEVALAYALHMAKTIKAQKLVFYHHFVQTLSPEVPALYMDDMETIRPELLKRMNEDVAGVLKKEGILGSSLHVEVEFTSGTRGSAEVILETAHKHKADLIVMGTHGKTGLEKLLFGSVTSSLIETSTIPILAIPNKFRFQPIGKIVYASSLNFFSHELKSFLNFAGDLPSEVEIVYVDYGLLSENKIASARHTLEKLNNNRLKLNVLKAIDFEPLKENLLAWLKTSKPDWLVMFSIKRPWYERLFLSSKILELGTDFKKPILILHKKEE